MIADAVQVDVSGWLTNTYDVVFIVATFIGGLWGLVKILDRRFEKQAKRSDSRFDSQDEVLAQITNTLSDHHERIVRLEVRVDGHDRFHAPPSKGSQ